MTTEDDFQDKLDTDPTDWQTRLVFADWLDENSDPRAEGYRALGVRRRRPVYDHSKAIDGWFFHSGTFNDQGRVVDLKEIHGYLAKEENELPRDWVAAAARIKTDGMFNNHLWLGYERTRRATEDIAARAFALLSAERRAELLRGPP